MSTFSILRDGLRVAGLVAVTGAVALPAVAGNVYSWRTEDGGYSFTDDPKAIPARYRPEAKVRYTDGMNGYDRLTAPPAGSGEAYSWRLASRLDRLRELNRDLDAAFARSAAPSGLASLSIRTGSVNLGVPIDRAGDGPVVVERVRFHHDGEIATRHSLVVKQGGKTLTIIRGGSLIGPIDQLPDAEEMTRESSR